ncbi:MAG TPA: Amuc_1098 family type IV pilus outer membrane protein [Chthoniobacterales bacterium]|nr:Amuc_1098 family type IV pilus outer membrane protein [Chthoniobacterales bacterium]
MTILFFRDPVVIIGPIIAINFFSCLLVNAQNVDRISKQEITRRQERLPRGLEAVVRGQAAMKSGNYRLAHDEFRTALNFLPDAVTSAKAHDDAVAGFCDSGVKLAEQGIADGNYPEAESIVREILEDRYDPNCRPAMELLAHLQQPDYFNRTMGPKFVEKAEEVKKLLADAHGYDDSGRYDLAFKKYEQVLAIDPFNTAARRGEEKIDNTRYQYAEEAYNETRGRAMWQVEKGWEQPVKQYGKSVEPFTESFQRDVTGTARITQKLNSIIIPRVEFRDASVREAIDFLRQQAAANDPNPDEKKGVDIVLRLAPLGQIALPPIPAEPAQMNGPAGGPGVSPDAAAPSTVTAPAAAKPMIAPAAMPSAAISPADARITITLNQIPLGEALRYIASQAGLKVKVEPYAVSIIPMSEQSNDLITKEYRVPPGFISTSVNVSPSALSQGAYKTSAATGPVTGATGTGKDTEESTGGHQLVNREGAKEFLESQGVQFPPGASAHFLPQSSRLIVRNTADNLELVDAIVEQASVASPKQVEIEAKFVEINQNNLKELGFDWLLGQFNVGNHKVFAGGGTSGTGAPINTADWPFVSPGGTQPIGQFPITAGNRSGELAISANAIDALLSPAAGLTSTAPGIFGLAGVFTDPQFQLVIRALNQKKGIDLLSAPKITTKSGQRAVIEIVREFRYPTQFTEPKVPDIQGRGSTNSTTTTIALPVVGPSTPSNFETRNTGVTLEVEPVVGPDGVTIDLNLVPQVVEFEGFINYGSPIKTVNPALLGFSPSTLLGMTTEAITLTDNVINQPIFSTRKVTTSVSVWDGQTVVLGGLMREDVQKVEDRTPFVGDLPLVGRLFRSNVDQRIKRNLIIFVTARLVNPAGQPVHQAEEEEEMVEPPVLQEIPAYRK